MFLEAAEIGPEGLDADLCIVGAGAAGITLALELRDAGLDIVLVESGGFEVEPGTQNLNEASQVGVTTDPLHLNRLRVFGGTTGHWGGNCFPLDEIDFEKRPWVPHSGWPFPRSELDAGYDAAHRILKIEDPNYDYRHWMTEAERSRGLSLDSELLRNLVIHVSHPPIRMGTEYRPVLERDPKVRVVFHANVVEVEVNEDASSVRALRTRTLDGLEFRLRARRFVLATGAVENTRLLLASNSVQKQGLGNDRDLVGRFFMQHIEITQTVCVGETLPRDTIGRGSIRRDVGIATGLSANATRDNQTLNWHCLLYGRYSPKRRKLVRRAARELRAVYKPEDLEANVAAFVANIDQEVPGDADGTAVRVAERPEQAPNPDSRLTLGEERDALGMPRLVMDWRISELDRHTLQRAREILAREVGRLRIGRLRDWPEDYELGAHFLHGGNHHYGTTRMNDDPAQGVTDRNARLHGIENLYVAGGSIFPTSGIANPTLTIVALAARLAGELKRQFGIG